MTTSREDCSENKLETAIGRFNSEFQQLERNVERVVLRYKKISGFVDLQKNIFMK